MADGGDMTRTFKPDRTNTRALRDAFGRFASGVTIVTASSKDGPVGITASSFSSLSLDPPLVLWSPDAGSYRFPYFEAATHFAIHVLGAEQIALCEGFAKSPFAFDDADLAFNAEGVPLINGCLARFECGLSVGKPRSIRAGITRSSWERCWRLKCEKATPSPFSRVSSARWRADERFDRHHPNARFA